MWVAQEILKLLINNPTWAAPSGRPNLRELQWNDKTGLQFETSENTRLLLRNLRLKDQIEKRAKLTVKQDIPQQEPSHPHSVPPQKKPRWMQPILKIARKIFT